jgi:hyperosmotically inducible protein
MKYQTFALIILSLGFQSFARTGDDNTKINVRDRKPSQLTSDQQNNKSSDVDIIRRIRQDIMKQENFSSYAKNVKVISINGRVTLKGPVRSQEEINSIVQFAKSAAGESNVINEMSVVKDK